jgi:hypothetical protein
MKKHSDIRGKEGENLRRQDFAADIIISRDHVGWR